MCGIFGMFVHKTIGNKISDDENSLINKRGPDGCGVWSGEFDNSIIKFLHTRLSIIDLTNNGHQPMHDEDSDWVITYNGEIYNYIEVRSKLLSLGWFFKGYSDTEVLLKAWAQWGLDALPHLNGMFAFAVYNKKTGEMWLIRDRFGVKPLVWANFQDKGIVFSSSVAAVAQSLDARVNVQNCAFGLRFKAFEGPEMGTPFVGVHSVPPGGWIRVQFEREGKGVTNTFRRTEGRWYDLAQAVAAKQSAIENYTEEKLLAECKFLLEDAVNLRLRSDVPLAVSLSGGLDSNTVAALAAIQIKNLHGFTFGSPQALMSEGPVVARFTNQVGITPHYIWPSYDAAGLNSLLERTLYCQEAPFPGLSVMAQNEVFCTVNRAGFKVVLGGQGGDEIFAGYRKFFVVAARHAIRKSDATEAFNMLYSLGLMLVYEAGQARMFTSALTRYLPIKNFSFHLVDWAAPKANLWGSIDGSLADRQIEDVQHWSIPTLLRYEDRNSMGHGVESRLPFMDYRLVEMALALPAKLKISNGFGKWAVRKITTNIVPDFIRLNRKKRGFDVTQNWIKSGLGSVLRTRIHENKDSLNPYLRKNLNIDHFLTDATLQGNSNILDEAIMLAWLAEPIRLPKVSVRPKE
jgi:asparagine synthase (glutamine-hydrolysing)